MLFTPTGPALFHKEKQMEKREMQIEEKKLYMTANEALAFAKSVGIDITLATLIYWIQSNKLGFQPGGNNSRWYVHIENFQNFIKHQAPIEVN